MSRITIGRILTAATDSIDSWLNDGAGNPITSCPDGGAYRLDTCTRNQVDIARSIVPGSSILFGFGERSGIGTGATGEDVWPGAATMLPIPADVGEATSFVSTSANDTAAGTGIQSMMIHYLDASGNPQEEEKATAGLTPVALTATDVRFVQYMHATAVGSNGVAVGDITLYQNGSPATVYNQISIGGNRTLTASRMVPLGKKFILTEWYGTEARDKRVTIRLRVTANELVVLPRVFTFRGTMHLAKGSLQLPAAFVVPALSIIKVTAWAAATLSEVSAGFIGELHPA